MARPAAVLALTGGAAMGGVTATAMASPSTPPSTVACSGTIRPDAGGPAAGNANPFDYRFSCRPTIAGATDPTGYSWDFSGDVWSYTIMVVRRGDIGQAVSYDAPAATVLTPSGAVDATQYVNCSSFVPSDGFGCAAPGPTANLAADLANGSGPAYLPHIPAGDIVTGAFALGERYCSFLPKGARPGTRAVPQATVELIVTDTNGVSEGPFQLTRVGRCPRVAAVVPEPKKRKKKSRGRSRRDRQAVSPSRQ